MRAGRTLIALFLLVPVAAGADKAPELHTLQGKVIAGEVVRITDKEIVQRSNGQETKTPLEEALFLELAPAGKLGGIKYIDVTLADGSLLHCSQVVLKGKEVEVDLTSGQKVKMALDAIASILNNAQDAKVQRDWQAVLAKKRSSDLLASLKDGEMIALNGTFGEADAEGKEIQFDLNSQGNPRSVKLDRIHGMLFVRPPNPQAPPVACKVYDTQTNLVLASSISVTADGYAITTPAGVKIDYPKALVAKLDYNKGKLTYLSDLEPVQASSPTGHEFCARFRDKNPDGDAGLRVGNKSYAKGLSLFATTMLEFDLGGDYREFSAMVGVDDVVGGIQAPIKVVIEGDGRELFSATVAPKELPHKVTCNVKDVRRLRIVISPGGSDVLDAGRHVDLADAKVSK